MEARVNKSLCRGTSVFFILKEFILGELSYLIAEYADTFCIEEKKLRFHYDIVMDGFQICQNQFYTTYMNGLSLFPLLSLHQRL